MQYLAKDLMNLVQKDIPNGVHTYTCTRNALNTAFQMINFTGSHLSSVADNGVYDSQMLIIKKSKGVIVIDKGVTIRPAVRKKAMIIVADVLVNYGRITMEARGSNAPGENVYLFSNQFVPAVGARGADRNYLQKNLGMYQTQSYVGKTGRSGVNRQSGGGGSGAAGGGFMSTTANFAGAGGYGTSYSGGAGSGAMTTEIQMREPNKIVNSPDVVGLAGSYAAITTDGNWWDSAMGGIGIPNGKDVVYKKQWQSYFYGDQYRWNKNAGTGGLLIIFANLLINLGQIDSNGSSIEPYTKYGDGISEGGCSGGGSVNIITGRYHSINGIACSYGGKGIGVYASNRVGGTGGNGCVTINQGILSVRLNTDIYKDVDPQYIIENDNLFDW